jgi:hypothetical protein
MPQIQYEAERVQCGLGRSCGLLRQRVTLRVAELGNVEERVVRPLRVACRMNDKVIADAGPAERR